ncbi:hypothetical protein GUJ93_ZPchr0005g16315 [Zizania palustris]|uniref:Uncharacterized protein n=1 Tax=Zizania palustris TaxID=103762 RepID=A0A8J5W160_ZIZPA|nr:hypothetical protein GUJ93_ZPchr0005g16315 [Zizania palustris]
MQFILARAAATSNELETNRLKKKVTTLQSVLKGSEDKTLQLEEELLEERRARAISDEALRVEQENNTTLKASVQEIEVERVVLRAEVEKLRRAAADSSGQLVELQDSVQQALAQNSTLLSRIAEVSASASELEAAEMKHTAIAEQTMDTLQDTLEYFGTMCPSS